MSETESQNLTETESILPDPLLDPGSFIEPNGPGPKNVVFAPGTVIAAQPISIVSPDGTPVLVPRPGAPPKARRNAEEMAKRPGWLPEDWRIDLKIRNSGATAGQIDRYYVAPTGLKFRSKIEVMHYLETGKKQKRKFTPEGDAGSSVSTSSGKQKKSSVMRKSSSSALKSDNNAASTTCS